MGPCAAAILAGALVLSGANAARAQELSDQEHDLVQAYDIMAGVTAGLMGTTAALGVVQLYNLPTSFGDGACARDSAIFGDYACRGSFSLVHAGLGIATVASYTATAALAFAAPNRDVGQEDTVTDVLGVVHGVGLGLTAVLGLVGANPHILGITGDSAREFSRHMRVVHWIVSLATAGAFATHLFVDHID
jgi:hypothetical protein